MYIIQDDLGYSTFREKINIHIYLLRLRYYLIWSFKSYNKYINLLYVFYIIYKLIGEI